MILTVTIMLPNVYFIKISQMIKNVLILVGGRGTRLKDLTKNTPKPMINFHGRPFLDYILDKLLEIKPKKIILLCCYKSNFFFKRYNNLKIKKTTIKCIKEKKPLGTGGSISNAKENIENNTLIINGDTYFKLNFNKLKTSLNNKKNIKLFCIKNKNYKSNKKLANLKISKGLVFFKNQSNLMNSGIYIINKKFKKILKKRSFSLENELLETLIKEKKVLGEKLNCNSIDIGTKKNFKKFKSMSKKINFSLLNNQD